MSQSRAVNGDGDTVIGEFCSASVGRCDKRPSGPALHVMRVVRRLGVRFEVSCRIGRSAFKWLNRCGLAQVSLGGNKPALPPAEWRCFADPSPDFPMTWRLAMTDPHSRTLEWLAQSGDREAIEVLMNRLDSPTPGLAPRIARLLLATDHGSAHVAVLRRLSRMPSDVVDEFRRRSLENELPMKQAIFHSQRDELRGVFDAILLTSDFRRLEDLLELAERPDPTLKDEIYELIGLLVEREFSRQCDLLRPAADILSRPVGTLRPVSSGQQVDGDITKAQRESETQREAVLSSLANSLQRAGGANQQHCLMECLIQLAHPNDLVARDVIWRGENGLREIASQILMESLHPGVVRFIAESLSETYPHPKAFQAVRERAEPAFVAMISMEIERRLGHPGAAVLRQNLKQIRDFAWYNPQSFVIEQLPPVSHPAVLAVIAHSGLSFARKTELQEWFLRYGAANVKLQAVALRGSADARLMQIAVMQGLESDDRELQRLACEQAVGCGTPEAMQRLVDLVDSDDPLVSATARAELTTICRLETLLQSAEGMTSEQACKAGELVRRIDPDATAKLERALAARGGRHRVRTIEAITRLGLQELVYDTLLKACIAEDPLTCLAAINAVVASPDEKALVPLAQLRHSGNARVRQAATNALATMTTSLVAGSY